MRARLCCLAVSVCLLLSADAWGTKSMQSGEAYFGVGLRIGVTPHLGEVFPLRVSAASAQHATDCIGRVKIDIPDGIEVVKGDTSRDVHVSIREMKHLDQEWLVFLRVARAGAYVIRG